MTRATTPGGPRRPGRPRKYDESDAVSLLLRLPGDLAARLAKRAARLSLSRTEAIQEAIRAWLAKR